MLEAAERLGVHIPRELVFYDVGVRGFKNRRPGLDALRAANDERRFSVFLAFATNRLFRKTYRALQFVEEHLAGRGIRCIFVKNNIDTASGDRWRTLLSIFCSLDEDAVGVYAENVRAAHEGLFDRKMVFGFLPLGFRGEDVPGVFTKRNRPAQRIVIDDEAADYVRRIFHWFVDDGLSINAIARRLNDDENAPAPAKSQTGLWTHALVRAHLVRLCYRGYWQYGRRKSTWSNTKDYAVLVPREKPLKSAQWDDLRLVSDEVWYRAQKRLASLNPESGRKPKDGDRRSRPQLLRGLFRCPEHDCQLVVGGAGGRYLFCPVCKALKPAARALYSELNRVLALERTCESLAELIRSDGELVDMVIAACAREVEAIQRADPRRVNQLRSKIDRLSRSIDFNRRQPGDTDEEMERTAKLIKELQHERASLQAELAALMQSQERIAAAPSEIDVRQMLDELATILVRAGERRGGEEFAEARAIVELLTGGRIELVQMGERLPQRGWLQGRVRIRLLTVLAKRALGFAPSFDDEGVDVSIDYRRPVPYEADADRAWELFQAGHLNVEIARQLRCSRSRVTHLLKYAFASRGQTMPDGRKRRALLSQKGSEPPVRERIADDVMRRYDEGRLLQNIASELQVDRNTVTAAVAHWHRSRGLPVPDGRTRRKELELSAARDGRTKV